MFKCDNKIKRNIKSIILLHIFLIYDFGECNKHLERLYQIR